MATQTGVITVNGIKIIECDTNPATGLGLSAPIGSLASAKDGSGIFYKNSSSDTAWSLQINSSQSKYKESFTYAGSSLTLSNNCSFMISLNWGNLGLNEGVDYTVSGTTLTILNTNINNGDLLYATYE